MPSRYFSYSDGYFHLMEDDYICVDSYDQARWGLVADSSARVYFENGYHLSVLNNYITIVANNHRCIFTNKDMNKGEIIGTIIWVKNFNELLKKFGDRNLKRISRAIVCPPNTKLASSEDELDSLDGDFFLFMDIYYPDIVFKYTIDTYMSNVCIDIYNKLTKCGLNGLVDKYITGYKQCDGYGEKGEVGYNTKICKCGGIRAFCYYDK
ncbi:hypothetical protein CONCODRAFT_2557 [Conidiobolus coronatus NRRL 28638]|uniref:Uncharacterized protein n=1 Tax=Conidiobolus coronatus (strain ATCC 28846 / CBS 209.66 / NRRL 28638) TaxID=796925 RepID=A0A137PH78_CONC2|nr:hypothetical protein CONCODRAFT_2557 [Conidiobolus coronatus NRRL 28638]|eukprot:KXN74353.1 hypothetical protein CONCODRAFT_2557 [Conidiobolus coronatus NRRL 28638]